ncbi:hypothetical protein BC833DRAFT_568680 [Globomyces pollinis-pini]|nr:hypothetical protein BC833DRAFT_568680 [Globomyces pollinis-pini]
MGYSATKFNLIFGCYVMILGILGLYTPNQLLQFINLLNSFVLPFLSSVNENHIYSDFYIITFLLVTVIGFFYVIGSIIGLIQKNQSFAISSVFSRSALCIGILYLTFVENRISSGFVIFVVQDGLTALITLMILKMKELDKESLELEKKTPLNTCLIGFFAFVVIGGAVVSIFTV